MWPTLFARNTSAIRCILEVNICTTPCTVAQAKCGVTSSTSEMGLTDLPYTWQNDEEVENYSFWAANKTDHPITCPMLHNMTAVALTEPALCVTLTCTLARHLASLKSHSVQLQWQIQARWSLRHGRCPGLQAGLAEQAVLPQATIPKFVAFCLVCMYASYRLRTNNSRFSGPP